MGADMDVLLHPNSGCAWADHKYWVRPTTPHASGLLASAAAAASTPLTRAARVRSVCTRRGETHARAWPGRR